MPSLLLTIVAVNIDHDSSWLYTDFGDKVAISAVFLAYAVVFATLADGLASFVGAVIAYVFSLLYLLIVLPAIDRTWQWNNWSAPDWDLEFLAIYTLPAIVTAVLYRRSVIYALRQTKNDWLRPRQRRISTNQLLGVIALFTFFVFCHANPVLCRQVMLPFFPGLR